MEALVLFLWGGNLEHVRVFGSSGKFGSMLGFLVVVGGYRNKAIIISIKKGLGVLSLLSYRLMVKILFKLALGMGD